MFKFNQNFILLAGIIAAIPSIVQAETTPLQLTLGGFLTTQVGGVSQKLPFRHIDPSDLSSARTRTWPLIVNDTKIRVNADGSVENLKYGMEVQLFADTSAAKSGNTNHAKNTSLYIETAMGRLEGGSGSPAGETLQVGANTIAKATGGIDGDMTLWINPKTIDGDDYMDEFLAAPYLPIGHDWTARANKLTYYTPSFIKGLQAGISYIPEARLIGTINRLQSNDIHAGDGSYSDVLDAVVRYQAELGGLEMVTSLNGQHGQAKIDAGVARSHLRAWELGIMLKGAGLAVAASYGDWGKSGTAKPRQAGKKYGAAFWTLGTSYDYKDMGLSLTYLHSKRAGGLDGTYHEDAHNKMRVLSAGMEYKIAPGLLPYAEVSHFKLDRAGASYNNSGIVGIGGLKVKF